MYYVFTDFKNKLLCPLSTQLQLTVYSLDTLSQFGSNLDLSTRQFYIRVLVWKADMGLKLSCILGVSLSVMLLFSNDQRAHLGRNSHQVYGFGPDRLTPTPPPVPLNPKQGRCKDLHMSCSSSNMTRLVGHLEGQVQARVWSCVVFNFFSFPSRIQCSCFVSTLLLLLLSDY